MDALIHFDAALEFDDRHGATFRDQADTDPLHPENVAAHVPKTLVA